MKKLYSSLAAKTIAVILLCGMVMAFGASAVGAMALNDWDAYRAGREQALSRALESQALSLLNTLGREYLQGGDPETLLYRGSNLRFAILDGQGEEIFSNYQGEQALWEGSVAVMPDYDLNVIAEPVVTEAPIPVVTPTPAPVRDGEPAFTVEYRPEETGQEYRVTYPDGSVGLFSAEGFDLWQEGWMDSHSQGTVPAPVPTEAVSEPATTVLGEIFEVRFYNGDEPLSFEGREAYETWRRSWQRENQITVKGWIPSALEGSDGLSYTAGTFDLLYSLRWTLLWILGLSFLLGVVLYVFLLRAAGHRPGTDAVTAGPLEKIPFDVFTLLVITAQGSVLAVLFGLAELNFDAPGILAASLAMLLIGLLFLLWSMSAAVRLKLGGDLDKCWTVRLVRWCWGLVKALWRGLKKLVHALPILWKWVLGLGGLAFVDLFWRMGLRHEGGAMALGWLLFWLLAGAATLYAALAFRRLRTGASRLAAGDLSTQVEEKALIGDFRDQARDLNHIRDGVSAAVEERMKSERLRTELITNVSHDIKTPLTSIVSYVDLLSKEEPESETMREYIDVLSRQSARLKKLIEDLIEASKASTGNLPVNWETVELGVLLDQTLGEYAERLEQAGLEPVVTRPEEPVEISADGRHMWRVLDNLMNNIVKYAMPGTRVYLDLERQGDQAVLTLRNISARKLGSRSEELLERFVRGDDSRSTEGSGLGLSIAMSLVKLQGGTMTLTVDGDLFKVSLSMPLRGE